jgi:hypothetical protein
MLQRGVYHTKKSRRKGLLLRMISSKIYAKPAKPLGKNGETLVVPHMAHWQKKRNVQKEMFTSSLP